MFFSPFSIAITSLRANLSAFRTFVSMCACLVLSLGVWDGLRFVTVALPGLFFYLFFFSNSDYVSLI